MVARARMPACVHMCTLVQGSAWAGGGGVAVCTDSHTHSNERVQAHCTCRRAGGCGKTCRTRTYRIIISSNIQGGASKGACARMH